MIITMVKGENPGFVGFLLTLPAFKQWLKSGVRVCRISLAFAGFCLLSFYFAHGCCLESIFVGFRSLSPGFVCSLFILPTAVVWNPYLSDFARFRRVLSNYSMSLIFLINI